MERRQILAGARSPWLGAIPAGAAQAHGRPNDRSRVPITSWNPEVAIAFPIRCCDAGRCSDGCGRPLRGSETWPRFVSRPKQRLLPRHGGCRPGLSPVSVQQVPRNRFYIDYLGASTVPPKARPRPPSQARRLCGQDPRSRLLPVDTGHRRPPVRHHASDLPLCHGHGQASPPTAVRTGATAPAPATNQCWNHTLASVAVAHACAPRRPAGTSGMRSTWSTTYGPWRPRCPSSPWKSAGKRTCHLPGSPSCSWRTTRRVGLAGVCA